MDTERDKLGGSAQEPGRRPLLYLAGGVAVLLALALAATAVVALRGDDTDPAVTLANEALGACDPVHVTTAESFAPVLREVGAALRQGDRCVDVAVTIADGRAAAGSLRESAADVWLPDDASWAGVAPDGLLAPDPDGRPEVVAQSPFYMVTDKATAVRIQGAGGTWRAAAALFAPGTGMRMVVRDPAGSGDGMVGAAGVGEAVWVAEGMDASSLALATAFEVTRTEDGGAPALPRQPGEVGVVPEYALLRFGVPSTAVVVAGRDNTPVLRYSWLPTVTGDPARADAVRRLHDALTGERGRAAIARAGLRAPDGAPAPGTAAKLPAATAAPFDILGPHHVEHVFATWYPEVRRADLLVAVDVSGSMGRAAPGTSKPLIDLVRQGVRDVGKLMPDDSRLGVWEFGAGLDGDKDYRVVLPTGTLDGGQRDRLAAATKALRAQPTGTGLHDTILAAYREATAAYRPGVPAHVFVFTDGRNEDDPGSITTEELSRELARARDPRRPVALSVVAFGDAPGVAALEKALEPVDADVEALSDASGVPAVFVHVAAGGPH
jgi:hypothetical protein